MRFCISQTISSVGLLCYYNLKDNLLGRPTEIPETDVYVCDSKYNEEEKQIKKMKSLKVHAHYFMNVA